MSLDVEYVRSRFSSLVRSKEEQPAIYFDNPGGTQVPDCVIEAVSRYYRRENANVGGAFETSRKSDIVVSRARQRMADFLNAADPNTIVFGANMTSLTFHLARSIAETIRPGDEIIVTNLDHDANVTPWTDLAANGAVIKTVDIDTADCTIDPAAFKNALSERTRLVAVTMASNAVGTIPDVTKIIELAHKYGALVYVDAVQFAPHCAIDVKKLDCDFLACSAYKFFGPHVGILYGKREHLEYFTPHKVRPSKNTIPHRWETGTLNHEGLAGVSAAIDYLADLGERFGGEYRNEYEAAGLSKEKVTLKSAMRAITNYEHSLSQHLLTGLKQIEDIRLYGITSTERLNERVPTFAFTWPRLSPRKTAEVLSEHGICCWNGNYYAQRLMERLGLEEDGGAVRIGLAHYNTSAEIDLLIECLTKYRSAA